VRRDPRARGTLENKHISYIEYDGSIFV